ncbi:uncharacterized protein LOC106373226 [Brassica napus]|uniref:uncharacterized protein LOC106373226 n=1 Tax=Brassica napus TaxID=3708 RepID=UPI0006AA8FA4|nr:uncharacterized protein LOC106373226 [Brassica napus]
MAVKTDMSKAYDRLEWSFITSVLERLGFHQHWIGLIMQCISTVTYSFLINGSSRGKVIPSRGIRQGDPLSPYIFILCSEVLSGLCNKSQADGTIQGIQVARGSPRINHLLFADDTMFFLKADKASTIALKAIITKYEVESGQSINREKSSITFSRKAPAELKRMIHNILQIHKEGGVGKYLGLPEQFGRRKRDIFSSVVERIKQKASSWSNRHLSPAGKLVMVQSVLTPIPSYSMSFFKLPVSLCKRIQSALTRFWWDDRGGKRKMAWISWPKLTLPKSDGGLGVRDIEAFNEALLAKVSWRLLQQPEGLLGRTLLSKYCPEGNLLTCSPPGAASHGWNSILAGRDLLVKNLGWLVGDGASINIWDDPWLSLEKPLQPMGPATQASAMLVVKDLIHADRGEWNRGLIQTVLPHWEDQILLLQPSVRGAPDILKWLGTKRGDYSVKSGYHTAMSEVRDKILEDEATAEIDWKKTVWNLKLAPKVKMFIWKGLKGILPTGERLLERHINVDPRCKRCGCSESINHLLFHCPFAREVWKLSPLDGNFEVSGLTDLRADWTAVHAQRCLPPAGVSDTMLVPWILWSIWKARNKFLFENFAGNPADTLSMAIVAAREWVGAQQEKEVKSSPTSIQGTEEQVDMVIRSDAAWSVTNKCAGLGWVMLTQAQILRGHKGASFVSSALTAEALALREAVKFGHDMNLKRVRFESDSAHLIKAINKREPYMELYGILEDILRLLNEFDVVVFGWISRESNGVADLLAKNTLSLYEQEVAGEELIPPPNN